MFLNKNYLKQNNLGCSKNRYAFYKQKIELFGVFEPKKILKKIDFFYLKNTLLEFMI